MFEKTKEKIDQLRIKLEKDLKMKDLGRPRSLFGIEMSGHKDAVYLKQKGLIERLLKDSNMDKSKSVSIPMNTNSVPREDDECILIEEDATRYPIIVRGLLKIAKKNSPGLVCGAKFTWRARGETVSSGFGGS